jgi:hypothetical protein
MHEDVYWSSAWMTKKVKIKVRYKHVHEQIDLVGFICHVITSGYRMLTGPHRTWSECTPWIMPIQRRYLISPLTRIAWMSMNSPWNALVFVMDAINGTGKIPNCFTHRVIHSGWT